MRIAIITGGSIHDDFVLCTLKKSHYDYVIALDHGVDFCRRVKLKPDYILGDFDSITEEGLEYMAAMKAEGVEILTFPAEKDETDTELGILKAKELFITQPSAKELDIFGATGTRVDHMLANIHLLYSCAKDGVQAWMLDSHNKIYLCHNGAVIHNPENKEANLSLLPFKGDVEHLTIQGTKYDVEDVTLKYGESLGISNVMKEKEIHLSFEGWILVVEATD